MSFPRLLAKSSLKPDAPHGPETLAGHLADVTRVAVFLADRWGTGHLDSLGLNVNSFGPMLRLALPRAAFLHDLGKGNEHFQRMVRAPASAPPQAFWHEQLSVWLTLRFEALSSWLFAGCDPFLRQSILAAVAGHHLRLEDAAKIRAHEHSGGLSVRVLSGHPDFAATLGGGGELLGLGQPPSLTNAEIDLIDSEPFDDAMRAWVSDTAAWWRAAGADERRFVAAVKALVIAADVVASATPRVYRDPVGWAASVLDRTCTPGSLGRVVAERLGTASPRPFQEAVAASTARVTFVRAGCGSGKTAAAYLWAARTAAGRKLFFCYPTTGTASQGFEDYVPPGRAEAALIHGRAAADLEDLLANGAEDRGDRLTEMLKLESLMAWDAPITVCTVDTVLGVIQNNRRGLFSFPAIANGAFVFDEVHQYDDPLFGALLRFLEAFRGVPVLLMTASLPRARLVALEDALARQGERLPVIEGSADLEQLKRYRIERAGTEVARERVREVTAAGGRVLWVSNTVDRAIGLAREAGSAGMRSLPYHSRYRYVDRMRRHRAVVGAFKPENPGGTVAVTTQVCEVSLDLSADLLVTDLAPVPALIQRMGRLNRRATPGMDVVAAPALVIEPLGALPYDERELALARQWLDLLGDGPLSQADLTAEFERVAEAGEVAAPIASAWLDGGLWAKTVPVREESATIRVLRQEDRERLRGLTGRARGREVIRLTIPMPLGDVEKEIGRWNREGSALVAPGGRMTYTDEFGGKWR